MFIVAAQIKGIILGNGKDEFPELLINVAKEIEERCLPMLDEKVVKGQTDRTLDGLD